MQSWLLIAIAFVLAGLFYGGFTIGAMVSTGATSEDLKSALPFDELPEFGLSMGLGFFGSVMLVIIASGMMGNEYSWNTLRPLVARARSRSALLTAKLLALLIYAAIFTVVLSVLIGGMSLVSSLIVGIDTGYSGAALQEAAWFAFRTLVINIPYLAVAFLLATAAKSNAAGIAGALGLSFIEPTVFGILTMLSDRFNSIQKGGLAWNTEQVLFNWDGSSQAWTSVGVLALYTVVFVGLSYAIFLRRDVTSG